MPERPLPFKISVLVFVQAFGQKGGDEQGLEAPEKFQLEADKEAVPRDRC